MKPELSVLDEVDFAETANPDRRAEIDRMIATQQAQDMARIERRRQAEKNRRVAVEASRRKNRRKK